MGLLLVAEAMKQKPSFLHFFFKFVNSIESTHEPNIKVHNPIRKAHGPNSTSYNALFDFKFMFWAGPN